ncbi:MAG: sigma-70 family RNA polymerase sigma factor [Clostridia bacterium]|nr:sigma-70 family RNA polymerase sigma factor [Clostridia bacterium]
MSIFQRRDAGDFEALIMRHERMIYLLCLRMTGNAADAQDCAQEAFLNAYRAYGNFRKRASEKTWLYRIAYNACLDLLRRQKNDASLEALRENGFDPADNLQPQPGAAMERDELRRQIGIALMQLPEDQRAVMILRDFQQMPYDEIARVLEVSEGTVKSRLSRAREKVKNILIAMEQNEFSGVQISEGRQK